MAADVVVVCIEDHFEIIGVHVRVAPDQTGAHPARSGVFVHAGPDVQRGPVEGKADFGPLGRKVTLMRLGLAQARRGRGGTPHGFVEATIQVNLFPERHSPDFRCRRGVDVLRY